MRLKNIIIMIISILLVSCGEAKHNSSGKSTVQDIQDKEFITFQDIKPLLVQKCAQCHNAESSLFNVLEYETAITKIDEIKNRVVIVKDMPSGNSMTELEREIIARWVEDGGLEGDETIEEPPSEESPEEEMPEQPLPEEEALSFEQTILPLFEMKCALCHNAGSGLFNVLDYSTVITKLDSLRNRVVVIKDMPQVGTMTDREREIVDEWISQGAEE